MSLVRDVRIKDTLSGEVRSLEPRDAGRAGIYACGPTVYGRIHVGNARPYVIFMLLGRFLEHLGYEATVVMNVTDVNDKIYDAANELGIPSAEHAAEMTRLYIEDTDLLGLGRPESEPLATETVPEIVSMIEALVERDHAYESGGDVYFRVRSFDSYGKLSNRDPDEMDQGEEAGTQSLKESPLDFALWKARKPGEDTAWDSPWGEGRPGWHIECSAMSTAALGPTFDIHTGGEDLIFPHHDDEIAQSEGATGEPFVRYWLHVRHLLVNGEKMSKSKGNDFTIDQLLERGYSASSIRFLLFSAQYRKELNFSFDGLDTARTAIQRLLDFERRLIDMPTAADAPLSRLHEIADRALHDFEAALDDDLNAPNALAVVFNFVRESNAELDRDVPTARAAADSARDALVRMDRVLGILELARAERASVADDLAAWVEALVVQRQDARRNRDFAESDRIRDELAGKGIVVEDTPQGPRWKKL
jgi:cysteinyl-tRNA synthetase